ncbi:MAG: hypothetical protein HY681_05580 [Chloroflexi bacterium]|nr:hypothetical protein [Chloroflexota bacterium]
MKIAFIAFLLIIASLFVSQALAASMTVGGDPIVHRTGSVVFEAVWSSPTLVKTWTMTANLSGDTVTTVTVSGTKGSNQNRGVRVQLLDGSGAVISTGCVATGTGAAFNNKVVNVVPDVAYGQVAKVRATGLSAC